MADRMHSAPTLEGYERPRVKRVVTPAELEREIVYAGQDTSVDGTSP